MIITVEMGEGVVAEAPAVVKTEGCGSCVIVTLYDAVRKIGGLAHVMMPERQNTEARRQNPEEKNIPYSELKMATVSDLVGQASCLSSQAGSLCHQVSPSREMYLFASTAVPALLDEMQNRGCARRNIVAKIAGGAKMFASYTIAEAGMGAQNITAVRRALEKEQIPLTGWDTGGRHGRSIEFHLASGRVVVKAFEREDREI